MKAMLNLVNQVFELEQKIVVKADFADLLRNIDRIKNHLQETGYQYHSPLNEKYTDTRTDCEANIVGDLIDNTMHISKVIKPIIYFNDVEGSRSIVQKAVVIAESRK